MCFRHCSRAPQKSARGKIAQGMKETDPGVFASVLTESVQKSIDKNSRRTGDSNCKVEKNSFRDV